MKITLRCVTSFLFLTFFLSSVSCLRDTIEVSNLPFVKEAKKISSEALKISNLFSHYPITVSRNDTALRQWISCDTTPHEDCYRDLMNVLIVSTKDTLNTFLNDVYFFNQGIHAKGYCDTIKDIDSKVHIVPDMQDLRISNEKLRVISCKSKAGDFWKVPNNCFRPECLGKWKHGYSKGIGIFEEGGIYKKVYWVHVW